MLDARVGHRLDEALGADELLLRLADVERLARGGLRMRGQVQALARAQRAVVVGAQVEAAAEVGAARIVALVDQVAQVQQAVGAAAHQLDAVLAGGVVHHHLVVAAAAVFLRAMAGQDAVAVPLRLDGAVVDARDRERPVAVAAHVVDQHLLADARHMHAAIAAAGVGLHHAHPGRGALVAGIHAIPDEAHANPVQLVGIDLLAVRPDHDRRLQMHLGLVVFERAAVRHAGALRLHLDAVEADRAVGMRDAGRRAAGGGTRLGQLGFEAVREMRRAGHGQVVLDPPRHLDRGELALRGRIGVVDGMVGQREAPARIERARAARAMEALGARLPFLHADLREPVTARLVAERVGAGVVVHLQLVGQLALPAHGRRQRALRIGRHGRVLVVERAGGQRDALQRARAGPLRERVGLGAGGHPRERHAGRREFGQRGDGVGHHQRVRFAVAALLPVAVEPLALEQAVDEVPVGLVLARVGTTGERLRERETEPAVRLRMQVEHVGDDRVGAPVDPDLLVAPEVQQVQPRVEGQLVGGQPAVGAEPARGEYVALNRPVALVGLLEPQRDGLRDQRFQRHVVVGGDHVERKRIIAPQPRTTDGALHDQLVRSQGGVEFHEPVLLNHTGLDRPRDILHVHGGSPFFLFSALGKRLIDSTGDCNRPDSDSRTMRV